MNWLKMSLLAPLGSVFLAIVCIVTYVLIPPEFSSIGNILGTAIFVLIVPVPVLLMLVSMALGAVEVLRAGEKLTDGRKILWLVLFWVFLGYFGVVLYYFTDRKRVIGEEIRTENRQPETGN